jgi:hypothetical protein
MDETPLPPSFQNKKDEVLNSVGEFDDYSIPFDVGSVIIYSPANVISKQFFYRGLGFDKPPHLSKATFEEMDYSYTTTHFEMTMSQSSINFIKSMSKSRSINGKKFMFLMTNLSDSSRPLQSAIKRLIDSCINTCVFVFALESLSGIDRGIIDRSCIVNLNKRIRSCQEQLNIDTAIAAFLYSVKSLKPFELLSGAKDLAYRLFHVSCPLARICRVIAEYFIEDEAIYTDVITNMAALERNSTQLHKNIFVYEQVVLIAAHKYAKMMSPQAKRKAAAMLTKPMSKLSVEAPATAPAQVPADASTTSKTTKTAKTTKTTKKPTEEAVKITLDIEAEQPAPVKKKTIRLKKKI